MIKNVLFFLGFMLLLIGTGIWISFFISSLQDYDQYYESASAQDLNSPLPYYAWETGRNFNITFIFLVFVWIPFLDYATGQKSWPYFRQKISYKGVKRVSHSTSRALYERFYELVFGYFSKVNRKVGAKIGYKFMKVETFEHIHLLTKVFKWIVLPSSLLYFFIAFFLFGRNAWDTMLIGIILFLYSNFTPDLPAIFRRKIYRDVRDSFQEELPKYKSYTLLLFAPFFILLTFCGVRIKWKTTETFHNFKSLAVYGGFIFIMSFFILSVSPISVGGSIEAFCVPFYAILGYLTHLRVDLIF